jgi:hypothetical protein
MFRLFFAIILPFALNSTHLLACWNLERAERNGLQRQNEQGYEFSAKVRIALRCRRGTVLHGILSDT